MANNLYIALYDAAQEVGQGPVLYSEILDIGAGADNSAALGDPTRIYRARIACDVACQYELGASPTADATSPLFLAAGQIVFDWFQGGWQVSVIEQQ